MRALTLVLLCSLAACTDPPPVRHHGVLLDFSASLVDGDDACDRLAGTVEHLFADRTLDPRSRLVVYGTTNGARVVDRLLATTPIPVPRGGLHGDGGVTDARRKILEGVRQSCAAHAQGTGATPLRLAVDAVVDDLRAAGCTTEGRCTLTLISDLVETVDPMIAAHVASRPPKKLPTLPQLDVAGIEVTACGYGGSAAFAGSKGAERLERTEATWREVLANARSFDNRAACPAPDGGV